MLTVVSDLLTMISILYLPLTGNVEDIGLNVEKRHVTLFDKILCNDNKPDKKFGSIFLIKNIPIIHRHSIIIVNLSHLYTIIVFLPKFFFLFEVPTYL